VERSLYFVFVVVLVLALVLVLAPNTHKNFVISTEAARAFASSAAEKPATLPATPPGHAALLPLPIFPDKSSVKPQTP
jgi:hypothetical protein